MTTSFDAWHKIHELCDKGGQPWWNNQWDDMGAIWILWQGRWKTDEQEASFKKWSQRHCGQYFTHVPSYINTACRLLQQVQQVSPSSRDQLKSAIFVKNSGWCCCSLWGSGHGAEEDDLLQASTSWKCDWLHWVKQIWDYHLPWLLFKGFERLCPSWTMSCISWQSAWESLDLNNLSLPSSKWRKMMLRKWRHIKRPLYLFSHPAQLTFLASTTNYHSHCMFSQNLGGKRRTGWLEQQRRMRQGSALPQVRGEQQVKKLKTG